MTLKNSRAGKSTRAMAKNRFLSALLNFFLGVTALGVVFLFLQNSTEWGIGGIGILVLLFLIKLLPILIENQIDSDFKKEKRAIRGARAEERIGEILGDLSDEFFVLDDIPSRFGNIDHIVIGKNSGVFLIETKAHGGNVEVNGETLLVNGKFPERNFISQALQNAFWLRDKIAEITGVKPWITPIIVFTNAFVPPSRPIKGVTIVNKKYILELIRRSNRTNSINTQVWNQREKIANSLY